MKRLRRAPIAVLLVALAVVGCGGPEWARELGALPEIDLDAFEGAVREQVAGALERVAEARGSGDRDAVADAYGDLGGILFNYELYDASTRALENALLLKPDSLRWNYHLAVVRQATGDLSGAIERLERAIELAADYLPAHVRLGELWIDSRRPGEARRQLERALELDPECALAHYFLGRAALADGDAVAAQGHLERALELQPQASAVHHLLAQAAREQGDLARAARHLEMRGDAVVRIRDRLFIELGDFDLGAAARVRRGARAQVAGDYDTAADEYREAVAADPDNPEARRSLGGVHVLRGENREAIEQYRAARRLVGDDPLVISNLGAVLAAVGETGEARQLLEQALELDPTLQSARLALASLLTEQGSTEAALAQYREVLERDVRNPDALLGKAAALAAAGDGSAAIAVLEAALEGSSPSETRARIHAELGRMLARSQDPSGALEQLEAAVELAPDLASARFARANLLGVSGRFREAALEYAEVLRLAPGSVPARLGGTTAWAMSGDFAKARECLEEGLEESPDPQLEFALARLLVTAPDPGVRDPVRALKLAETLHERAPTLESAETLALALAANDRCAEAVEREREVARQAERAGSRGIASRVASRLAHHQRTGTCRPPWAS